MIRPVRFGFNAQTAESNRFQQNDPQVTPEEIQARALHEFDIMVSLLRSHGITVTVFEDTPSPHTPDSIFPNNWISFHANGKMITYPMESPNRQAEVREDIIDYFLQQHPNVTLLDWTGYVAQGKYLEGTGSMIMDRDNQKVYACYSSRTDEELLKQFADEMDLEVVGFHGCSEDGTPIYHTNVMMALGEQLAIVCLESIADPAERDRVIQSLEGSGHQIVPLTFEQMNAFAGNMLQLQKPSGQSLLLMSQRACTSLRQDQLDLLGRHTELLVIPLDVIETYGGGSVRCMMAEVFL
jgi:hypothetical protein